MLGLSGCYNMTIEVAKVPVNTPSSQPIYISGNFNNWDPGDSRYVLAMKADSTFEVKLPRGVGAIEYKFTRGDWTTVEKDPCGNDIPNRSIRYGKKSVFKDSIGSWNDLPKLDCRHITIVISQLPDNTPPGSLIAIAGTMNNWTPLGTPWEFQNDKALGKYVLTIPRASTDRTIEYKITRGNLDRAESDELGFEIPPRTLTFGEKDTIYIKVRGWEDLSKQSLNMLTILVTRIPANTPPSDKIYICGSFNQWYPRQAGMTLERNNKGQYFIRLPKHGDWIEYKFTRGDWSSEEVDKFGYKIENRFVNLNQQDTVKVEIENWIDLSKQSGVPVRVIVDKVPIDTPPGDKLYIAGNFNNWNPGDPNWILQKDNLGNYFIDIPRREGTFEFKITRGNWRTVECQASGEDIENRSHPYQNLENLKIEVQGWKDKF